MPSGGGRSGTSSGSNEANLAGGSSPGGSVGTSGASNSGGSGGISAGGGDVGGNAPESGVASRLGALIPPMIIVLVASVGGIIIVAVLIILLLKRRGRNRRLEREMEQVKLNEEMVFVQTRTPDTTTSRETPGETTVKKGEG
ncbi:keratin, type II cytoskeletal 1-like, partial [Penaeus japonicus]|uniref:keratin, type II cytoskeletal 1-like n=1 Tax=Penaeus japonicus TaxID=27405 RepID=UPI001C70F3E1